MEDDLIFFGKMKTTSKNRMQHKTIASKNNDCGTAPGNLVIFFYDETRLIRKLCLDNRYLKTSEYNEHLIGKKSTNRVCQGQNQNLVGLS